MGCTQSKIDQDEAVSRCKERKILLSTAVSARNAFAAAHSAYAISLKNTGAALSDYAHAELPLSSSVDHNSEPSSSVNPAPPPPPPVENLPPPPPPLPADIGQTLQRSVSMPDIPLPPAAKKPPIEVTIEEDGEEEDDEDDEDDDDDEDDEDEHEEEEVHSLSKPPRPHHHHHLNPLRRSDPIPSTITINASPPRPPPSSLQPPKPPNRIQQTTMDNNSSNMSNPTAWDFFFGGPDTMHPPTTLEEPPPYFPDPPKDEKTEKLVKIEKVEKIEKFEKPPPPPPPQVKETPVYEPPKVQKKVKPITETYNNIMKNNNNDDDNNNINNINVNNNVVSMESSSSSKRGRMVAVVGPTVNSMNLLKIISILDDHFLKAYESAGDVSKMLEAARLHYHSNFAGSKGHIDHSAKIMRVITWNRSFKGLQQQDDFDDKAENEEHETHATILDKMLAWEKKLYDEVKAGEVMKVEYQRKVALLNKQKKRGARPEVLEKTKAAVSHLHTRYIVDMQSMDSTVSEIDHLRDDLLYPKLCELVSGMRAMWKTMHDHHKAQMKLVIEIRAPFEIALPPLQTTPEHYAQTSQLHHIVKELHLQLQKLLDNQKEYVKNLNGWLRLNLIPIESNLKEKVSSPPRQLDPPIKRLLHVWNDYITKLPLELARSAILSFSEIVRTIIVLQEDELTAKRKYENTHGELERKRRQFQDWSRKVLEKRASSGEEAGPEMNPNQDPIVERRVQIEQLELRLKEEQENHRRLCKQVREKSIGSLRTHLPELFRALSDFSLASSEMYRNLESIERNRDHVLD